MGYPMEGHLAKTGFEVTVYNRTTKKVEKWVQEYRALTVIVSGDKPILT